VVILAGPNGAGKSTAASGLLSRTLAVHQFVNADDIAQELASSDAGSSSPIAAGRIMRGRLRDLARKRVSFAFETTLANRTLAPWLRDLRASGYNIELVFLWLPSAEFAVERVTDRVRMGGHAVPAETIRRRYDVGLRNLFHLYMPLASAWRLYDGSSASPRLVADGLASGLIKVYDEDVWEAVKRLGAAT
jgi:predicted ABC-type ATPase